MADAYADGVRIDYDDLGTGEPALLFLTGWCSSRARWAKVAALAAPRRRVLSFDWRGHGGSGPANGDFGVDEMVADALAVIEASGAETIVPCAASHSGWVAIELRRRLGDRVPRLVHADWMLSVPSDRYIQVIRQLDSDEWPAARDLLFEIWAAGQDEPWLREALAVMDRQGEEMWRRGGRVIGSSYDANTSPLETWSRFDPPVPVLHIYGQPHDPAYLALQEEFADGHDWFSVRKLDAITHFAMLEQPEHVAAAIEEFVA
jgi:pimeloyl-ACP methyl ester carboxylesterase